MSKVDIKRLDSVTKNDTTATEQINDNFQALQTAIENTVSRDGTVPNYMDADLDLNSYRIINAGDPVGERDVVTLKYFEEKAGGAIEAAAEAKASASKAASSAQSALVASNNAIGQLAQAEGLLTATEQYVDAAKADINSAVSTAESTISTIVSDAEGSITNIAVTEANKAIANAAQEATDTAKANVNSYVDGTVKPSLQTYVDQAQENANSAATSMEQAALSATSASSYASNASADADNSAESAGLAANSAAAAATSKTNAKTSETNAKIWAEGTDAQVQALGGEKSAKGWAEASTNLDYTNITNCITEIPQDIKLELADGVLTLKEGSKVYVPNGFEADGTTPKFDIVNIQSDISWVSSTTEGIRLAFKSGNYLAGYIATYCYSGNTTKMNSTTAVTYGRFYNTETNKMYKGSGTNWIETADSLPVCLFTNDTTSAVTSIDQIFNGFGYIGSTIFALPGVKGLIPNGRNADGSLKNTGFTTQSVLTYTISGSSSVNLIINQSGYYPSNNSFTYNSDDNFNYQSNNKMAYCDVGFISIANGVITSFAPKTAFHAVDWNDIEDKLNHLNNPFFFGMSQYFESEPKNASWLISNGSYHSGATYASFYEWLLKIKNGTLTVDGVSVKAYGASGITDYDYVINTANTTFRLPLLNGAEDLPSSKLVGISLSGTTSSYIAPANGFYAITGTELGWVDIANATSGGIGACAQPRSADGYGRYSVFAKAGDQVVIYCGSVPESGYGASFIYAQGNGSLYFYVGETIQDANVINAAGVLTDVATLKGYDYVVESYKNGTEWYRIYKSGWVEQGGIADHGSVGYDWNQIVTLLKAFSNTNYIVLTDCLYGSGGGQMSYHGQKTASNFKIYQSSKLNAAGGSRYVNWYACGQGE